MRRPFDCVVGLRQPNEGSGVGLFNRLLARHLGAPSLLLDGYRFPDADHPLVSLKFEELPPGCRERLARGLRRQQAHRGYSLFLHTLDRSEEEGQCVRGAARVFCANDWIYEALRRAGGPAGLTKVFAPSLLPEEYQQTCRPGAPEFFYFGMASKVDFARFLRLRDLLREAGGAYKLLCSLAVHQTSSGGCLPRAVDFFRGAFEDHFVFLGTLTDMGLSYFLNASEVFVGFYRDGVRSNNTTFNTALRFGKKIVTNLDEFSPPEACGCPDVLNIDRAAPDDLASFLGRAVRDGGHALAGLFSWDELIARLTGAAGHPVPARSVA